MKTNVNYTLVAEFVIESKNTDQIFEALSVIKLWKPVGTLYTSLQITQKQN